MQRLSLLIIFAIAACAPPAILNAHELPYEVVTYITIDGARLHVLARVPMPLLTDARLPTRDGGYLDLATSEPALRAVALDLARNLDLMDHGRPLPPPASVAWAVTKRADTAFDTYDTAVARFSAPPLPIDTPVDPSLAAVDVRLEYALPSTPGVLSVRVSGFRARVRPVQMRVHYAGGPTPRTFLMTGAPRRVELEPDTRAVAPIFARLGMERLALGVEHLLFILCLAIPLRRVRTALVALGAFAAGYVVSLAAASLVPGPPAAATLLTVQTLVAAALVIVALQNVTEPRFFWIGVLAAVFGLVDGLSFGFAYRDGLPLAGAHTLVSFVSFAAPILIGSLWLLLVLRPLVALVYRSQIPSRWVAICLSAVPIHVGLHGLMALRSL